MNKLSNNGVRISKQNRSLVFACLSFFFCIIHRNFYFTMPNNKHFHNESKYLLKINITNLKMMFEIQPVVKSPHIEPNRNIILCACHNLELIYQPALFLSIFFIKNLQILLPVLRKFKFRFSSQ